MGGRRLYLSQAAGEEKLFIERDLIYVESQKIGFYRSSGLWGSRWPVI